MKWLDNLTVKSSWSLVLAAFTLMILLIGGLSAYSNHYNRAAFETLNRAHVERTRALSRAYINLLQAQVAMDRAAELIRVPSFDEPEPVIKQARGFMDQAAAAYQRFLDASPTVDPASTAAIGEAMDSLMGVGLRLQLVVLEEGDFASYRSGRRRVSEMNDAFVAAADQFLARSEVRAGQLVSGFDRMVTRLDTVLLTSVLLALALVATVLWGITVNVIRPLRRLVTHCERMADGDLSVPVERRGGNEIGQLYEGLGRMRGNLAALVGQVRASGDSIHAGSRDIASTNSDLSARFEQLAASLEQTSAGMEQLMATVQNNDDHARQADDLSQGASRVARRGGEAVREVAETMDGIRRSSERIQVITGRIEGIAFQTNILALNASVEAARAGEHGSGFAVVAAEVRELAGGTASLAKEIRALIGDTVQRVEQGAERVDQAGETMAEMLTAVDRVTGIMAAIRVASKEQTRGIEEAGRVVLEMDQVTQGNVARVAGAAGAADRLEAQARTLSREMALFTLGADDDRRAEQDAMPASPAPLTLVAV